MIPVSDTYSPFPALRRVGVGVKFGVVDLTAKPGATSSVSEEGALPYSRRTINDIYTPGGKYASLERNLWRLDGTFDILPDDTADIETGWWTESISGEDGVFATAPWIRYDFAAPVSTIGWSLFFDDKAGQFASSVRATCYDAEGAVMDVYEFVCASAVAYIEHDVAEYSAVLFEFLSTSEPCRRVRLVEVDFGLAEVWDADRVGSVTLYAGLDPMAATFPAREVLFTFDNSDMVFDLFSPEGLYQYLQDGQEVEVTLVIGGESVYMGQFSFTDITVQQTPITPTIQADDIVLRLDGESAPVGNDGDTTLSSAVSLVLGDTVVSVVYGDGCAERAVRNSIGENVTKREALRLLAQAAMCSVWTDRYGAIHIAPADPGEVVQTLTPDVLYDYTGVSVAQKIDVVELTSAPIEGDKAVYTAGSGRNKMSVSNPCVASSAGASVAEWMLAVSGRRKRYSVRNRCDPAVDIGDTLRIHDIYKHIGSAVVTSYEITFGAGLSCITGGVGQ